MKRPSGSTRSSTKPQRKRKVAERVRHIDASALQEAAAQHLNSLENDNYAAEQEALALDGEDEYAPGLDSDGDMAVGVGAKGKRARKSRSSGGKRQVKKKEGIDRWNMPLAQILLEDDGGQRPKCMVLYDDITARPSVRPPRPFCSVCGYHAAYTCTRCGVRFCSVACGDVHSETRCLKYAM